MQRLFCRPTSSGGKTAVAVYALLVAVANKHQAALMAPTEVLARQHWRTLEAYLAKSRGAPFAPHRRPVRPRAAARPLDAILAPATWTLVVGTQGAGAG